MAEAVPHLNSTGSICSIDFLTLFRVPYVLFIKTGRTMKNRERTEPFFVYCSFDVRGRPLSKAVQWADPHLLGPRAYFVTVSKPASLTMDSVRLEDAGIYRCRVDFKTSPTRNFAINLTVIGKFLLLVVSVLVNQKSANCGNNVDKVINC